MVHIKNLEIQSGGAVLQIDWENGLRACFHAVWLRDHARDENTFSPANGQRLVTILEQPDGVRITNVRNHGTDLEIVFGPEDKKVTFPADWLADNVYDSAPDRARGWVQPAIKRWDSELQPELPVASYGAVNESTKALADWLEAIRSYGVARMTDVPVESGAVCSVAELFGFVRETNYGRFFEVRTEVNPTNLAFTGLGLQVHTDNPYRDPVPTLQLLACLENSADGGDSVVVDGFKAAHVLQQESAEHFDLLSQNLARFTYVGHGDVHLATKQPMIELGADGELRSVRFNNRSMGPLVDIPFDAVPGYYAAYRHLAEIMERPAMTVTFKLRPGDLFIVDNTRVLHGRLGYSGAGSRWLQGCYADKDSLLSTLAVAQQGVRGAVA